MSDGVYVLSWCIFVSASLCMCVGAYLWSCACLCMCVNTSIHIYIHIRPPNNTHTHTHLPVQVVGRQALTTRRNARTSAKHSRQLLLWNHKQISRSSDSVASHVIPSYKLLRGYRDSLLETAREAVTLRCQGAPRWAQ